MEAARLVSERSNYLNKEIVYLKNTSVSEYDIKSAGFTVIKSKKLLPPEEIQELEKLEKYERNVRIGKRILQFPKISEEINNTLADVRRQFVILNNIEEDAVLSVKKDAMFIIKVVPTVLKIGDFEFRQKRTYTSYCYLNQKEFYYAAYGDELEIKGLSEDPKKLQQDFLLRDIKKIMSMAEKLTSDQLFVFLKQYRSKYLSRSLSPETYRDLDSGLFEMEGYQLDHASQEMLADVDISQNYIKYMIPLFSALV
jgi:hypothetical protein